MNLARVIPRRIARASLAVKIATLGGVVTALIVFGTFWALNVETRDSARRLFVDELGRHQRALLQLQRRNLSQLITSAAIITQSPTLRSALETYRAERNFGGRVRRDLVQTVQRELAKLLRQIDHDVLVVTDNTGRVFAAAARGGRAPASGLDLSATSAVRRTLDPGVNADSGELAVFRVGEVSYQAGVYPLILDGHSIGSVLLGERLDEGLVASARAAFGGEIVVKAGSVILASTVPGDGPAMRDALTVAERERGQASVRVGDTEYVGASLSLGHAQNGDDVRLWLLQPLDRTVSALGDPLRRDFVVYGVIAIFLTVAGSGLAARSALAPVHRFVAFLRSGAGSPATAGRAIVERTEERLAMRDLPAEVRELKESFGQLMDSIAAKQQQLTQRTTELATANAVLVDEIRERKRVENELLQRDEQLRQSQKLEAVGTLAGGIAHDFNNLITAVSGFTQLAMMGLDAKSPVTADLKQVIEAANRAGHLTKQLLAFSRKQVLQPTVLDVAEVVHTLAPMLGRLLGEQVKLRVEAPHDVARVLSDRGQLEQVILNLAINARDAMPGGGKLTIAVANVARPASKGHGAQTGVAIKVSDTGTGIPPEIRERIFEPFFTTKEPGKGTGLGLSTVYGIIKQSGGCIEVDSRVGFGTTFTITLPTAPQRQAALQLDEEAIQLPRGQETILLVEDDDAVRGFARRTLEDCGYTVLPASDPLEALRLASQARVDVILSDMMMPNLTGAQFVERFLMKHPAPIVIFMSGYADEALVIEGRAHSAAYLRKPFTPAVLAKAVRDAIDASRRTFTVAL